jgi:hypothetical protein
VVVAPLFVSVKVCAEGVALEDLALEDLAVEDLAPAGVALAVPAAGITSAISAMAPAATKNLPILCFIRTP